MALRPESMFLSGDYSKNGHNTDSLIGTTEEHLEEQIHLLQHRYYRNKGHNYENCLGFECLQD
jgi:hypothetical protein